MTKKFLVGPVLGAMLSAAIITGCTADTGQEGGQVPDRPAPTQVTSEQGVGESGGEHSSGREGNESGGEHSSGREGNESGGEHSSGREGNESSEEGGEEGGGSAGEHGSGGDWSSESSDGGGEDSEAAMSSPITPLGQPWHGVLGGLAVSMQYDAATRSVHGTVRNTLSHQLCHVQAEPHLKSGTRTVGELGPDKLGDLGPGQEATSSLTVASEPKLAGVSYDGYVIHMEVYDCGGPGPAVHSEGEGTEGSGEHGPGDERGNESSGSNGEEITSGNSLAPDETLDAVRSGARLVLSYDAPSNSFKGTVENTTNGVLERVRIEVHLSNGTELGPTTPGDMAPGEVATINLPATQASFTGWTAHAEVGAGEGESESGGGHGGGGESGGEHSGNGERGSGGEHRNGG